MVVDIIHDAKYQCFSSMECDDPFNQKNNMIASFVYDIIAISVEKIVAISIHTIR